MNKAPILLLLFLMGTFSFGKVYSYANENEDVKGLEVNNAIKIDGDSKFFNVSEENKNRIQFRIKDSHNDENSEFKLSGTISASSSNSITIDGKLINIDPSVTKETKLVGNLEVGANAMVKGIVVGSDLYAEQIVVNERNKNNIKEENEVENENEIEDSHEINATLSATPAPTITVDGNDDENATMTAKLDFGNIISVIQNFLNYLKDIAYRI